MHKDSCSLLACLKSLFRSCCSNTEKGHLKLAFGTHQVEVHTKHHHPHKVYLATPCCNHQVCGADVTTVGAVPTKKGFVLFADVKSDSCTVEWVAEFCECCCEE